MFKNMIGEKKVARDNPNKFYEYYSYTPSFSRSKHQGNNNLSQIDIKVDECRYLPLISEYFIREYIPYEIE